MSHQTACDGILTSGLELVTTATEPYEGISEKTEFEPNEESEIADQPVEDDDDEFLPIPSSTEKDHTILSDGYSRNKTLVIKGFGSYIPTINESAIVGAYNFYPPDSNAAYDRRKYESPANRSRPPWKPSLDGVAFVKEQIEEYKARDQESMQTALHEETTLGESIAELIQWDRKLYSGGEVAGIEMTSPSLLSLRSQYVKHVNEATEKGHELFMYCKKCQKRHIPPGPNAALGDRDTCLSMLPEWFPKDRFPRPWDEFIELMNDFVKLDEIEKGWKSHPDVSVWEKSYHEACLNWGDTRKWGGWWKCRSATDGEDIPEAEAQCRQCHQAKTRLSPEEKRQKLAQRRKAMEVWITNQMKEQMAKDKAVVQAQLR